MKSVQDVWNLLCANSLPIQTIASIASLLVASLVGWVSWRQKQAAEAQTAAAKQQAAAAVAQTEAANRQIQISFFIADRQTSPVIEVSAAQSMGAIVKNSIAFQNIGAGTATCLRLTYQDGLPGHDALRLPRESLGPNESTDLQIEEERAARSGLQLEYQTPLGSKCLLKFKWNGLISKAVSVSLSLPSTPFGI